MHSPSYSCPAFSVPVEITCFPYLCPASFSMQSPTACPASSLGYACSQSFGVATVHFSINASLPSNICTQGSRVPDPPSGVLHLAIQAPTSGEGLAPAHLGGVLATPGAIIAITHSPHDHACPHSGFVGLGFSPDKTMFNSDVSMGFVDTLSNPQVMAAVYCQVLAAGTRRTILRLYPFGIKMGSHQDTGPDGSLRVPYPV